MSFFNPIRTWAADRGYGQYPIPRSRPEAFPLGVRIGLGMLCIFAIAVLLPILGAELVIFVVAIRVALGG